MTVEIPKPLARGGPWNTFEGYRGVMVADALGKVYHRWLRQLVQPFLTRYCGEGTCGGLPKMGCDFASHYVQEFQLKAVRAGMSYAMLFVDISGAFDSVVRNNVFGSGPGTAMSEAGVPQMLVDLIASVHATTWTSVQGCKDIARTFQGSRPGMDLIRHRTSDF
eukprot:TRINITY_DN58652_c0_g1_i1.p2 TRINITY_DN58652_c0_g1~~TRINITY_DN58652_c0_g1_i1.p2  ORF type:complete len:164 (+),score=7.91 TRINITY_DN58652_c0_g1_i1:31-522(+)